MKPISKYKDLELWFFSALFSLILGYKAPIKIKNTFYFLCPKSIVLTSFTNHWQKAGEIHSLAWKPQSMKTAGLFELALPTYSKQKKKRSRDPSHATQGQHSLSFWALDSTGETWQHRVIYPVIKLKHSTSTVCSCL